MMAELDDLPVGVVELLDRGSKRGGVDRLGLILVTGVLDPRILQVTRVGRFGVPASTTELVADAIHGDAEQPGLESALLVVAVLAEFGRYGDKHGLGDLLGKVVVMKPGACHRKDPAGIRIHESAPSSFLAFDRLVDEETDRLVFRACWLGLDTQRGHHPCGHNAVHALVLPEPILYLRTCWRAWAQGASPG